MQDKKASEIDFDSFAEEQVDLEDEQEFKKGFARLKSSQIVESQDVEGVDFTEEYIVFNCIFNGSESGVVSVNKRSELYEFLLEYTDSDGHSDLAGKYIPVDKVSDGVYKPSNIFKSCIIDPGLHQFGITIKKGIDICVSLGFTKFNMRSEKWEASIDKDFIPFLIFIYSRKLIVSGLGAIFSISIVNLVLINTIFSFLFSLPRIERFSILGLVFIILTLILYKVLTASESYLKNTQ